MYPFTSVVGSLQRSQKTKRKTSVEGISKRIEVSLPALTRTHPPPNPCSLPLASSTAQTINQPTVLTQPTSADHTSNSQTPHCKHPTTCLIVHSAQSRPIRVIPAHIPTSCPSAPAAPYYIPVHPTAGAEQALISGSFLILHSIPAGYLSTRHARLHHVVPPSDSDQASGIAWIA